MDLLVGISSLHASFSYPFSGGFIGGPAISFSKVTVLVGHTNCFVGVALPEKTQLKKRAEPPVTHWVALRPLGDIKSNCPAWPPFTCHGPRRMLLLNSHSRHRRRSEFRRYVGL